MNYSINLLPVHLRPQTGIDTKHMVAVALIGVVLVCGSLFGYQLFQERQVKRELSDVSQEIQLLQPAMQQIQKNKAMQTQINARAKLLVQIEKERSVKWSELLMQLGTSTPDNLWLIQLSSDGNGMINLRGGANDIDTVTKYAENLRHIPNIANVSFLGLVQTNINEKAANPPVKSPEIPGLNVVMFDLRIQLKGGMLK